MVPVGIAVDIIVVKTNEIPVAIPGTNIDCHRRNFIQIDRRSSSNNNNRNIPLNRHRRYYPLTSTVDATANMVMVVSYLLYWMELKVSYRHVV